MKFLSHKIGLAEYISADNLILEKYVPGSTGGNTFYGTVSFLDKSVHKKIIPVAVTCCDELAEEIAGIQFPGGVAIHFVQQKNNRFGRENDWLIEFSAQNILASKYARLKNEDVRELLASGGLI